MQNILATIHDKITSGNVLVLPAELASLPSNLLVSLSGLYPGEDFGDKANNKEVARHKAIILSWIIEQAAAFATTAQDVRARITMTLVAREAQLSCGIGNGLALPHCMTALVENDIELVLVVSPQPLEWHSLDASKTTVLLVALFKSNTPEAVNKRMRFSVVLARLLRETGLVAELESQRDPEKIAAIFRRHVEELDS